MVTIVCAANVETARGWCRRNGVPLHPVRRNGRTERTMLCTPRSPHGVRGRTLYPEDRVIYVGEFDAREIETAMVPAGLDRSRIERFAA